MIRSCDPIRAWGLWDGSRCGELDMPFEKVELVAEGGGDQIVIVNQLPGGLVTGAIGNAPAHQPGWAGHDL